MVQLKSKNIVYFGVFISLLFLSSSVYAIDISVVTSIFSSVTATISSFFVSVPVVPVINTAYLDKQKYIPGEQMIVTASVSDAESVVTYIETEVGVDEVKMVLVTGTKEEGTWQVAWTLHDTLTKEYYTRIVAVSSGGIDSEIIINWFDPTVSHGTSELIADADLEMGNYDINIVGSINIDSTHQVKGDADGNWVIDGEDVTYITNAAADIITYPCPLAICDIDSSGGINSMDALMLTQAFIRMINPLDVLPLESVALFKYSSVSSSSHIYAGNTTDTWTGDMGGYVGVKAKCDAEFTGTHMCTANELVMAQQYGEVVGTGRYSGGVYIYYSGAYIEISDCRGWFSNSVGYGNLNMLDFGNIVSARNGCSTDQPILCCYN